MTKRLARGAFQRFRALVNASHALLAVDHVADLARADANLRGSDRFPHSSTSRSTFRDACAWPDGFRRAGRRIRRGSPSPRWPTARRTGLRPVRFRNRRRRAALQHRQSTSRPRRSRWTQTAPRTARLLPRSPMPALRPITAALVDDDRLVDHDVLVDVDIVMDVDRLVDPDRLVDADRIVDVSLLPDTDRLVDGHAVRAIAVAATPAAMRNAAGIGRWRRRQIPSPRAPRGSS